LPISAVDSINLAIEHTKQQLFKPFRLGQWTRLAFVGLLAGELGGSNGCSRSNFHFPRAGGTASHPDWHHLGIDPALLAVLITAVVVGFVAIGIILMYIGSVMRFILFDSIITKDCHIRAGWSRRLAPGWRYFVWMLVFTLLTGAAFVIFIGLPLAFAFVKGWLHAPKEHLAPLILGGLTLFGVFLLLFLFTALVVVLTKDFVVPQMALDDVDAMEGWRRLWPMLQADKGGYAGYIGMKILFAIAAGILIGIATLILGLIIALPSILLGALAVLTGKAAGLTWNAGTIALAVVVGCIVLAVFLYLVSLISVPVIVFFPAYSIYFFAARYPRLSAVLYPPPAVSPPSAAPAVF
jgi:hypothetical protein